MSCDDQKDACPGECIDCGEYKPLSSEAVISRAIDFAVSILFDLDNAIGSDVDYDKMLVQVNAARLVGICESLLSYAERVDDVNIKDMFDMCAAVQEHSEDVQISSTLH